MGALPRQSEPVLDAAYFEASSHRPIHFMYERLEPYLPKSGLALELGFGAGNGVLWFLARGFRVVAVDQEPMAIETLMPRLPPQADVELLEGDMATIEFPKCDVVAAGFSLFMVPRSRFPLVWKRIKGCLGPGGLIAVNLLGDRDEWNDGVRTVHTRRGAKSLFRDFEILFWEEHEREGTTVVDRAKYWHAFHIVARKR